MDDISYNLTKHEALTYLENILGIPDPVSFVNKNKVAFLQEMMRQTKLKLPFTNHTFMLTEDILNVYYLQEIKQALFKHEGGNCMALNTFTSAVLQCLGFDTYLIGASIQKWKVPLYNNHTAVITKHLTAPDSLHLVDVGCPIFLPLISLDFDRVSQVYHTRGLQYRLFQVSPGVVQLTRKCEPPKPGLGDGLIYAEDEEFWKVLITYRTSTTRKLAECHYQNDVMKKNPDLAPGVADGFLFIGYPNNLFVNITNNHCLTTTESGHTEATQMENSAHVIDTVLKYFPQYSRNHLEKHAYYSAKKS
ncbi:hypothetical protein HOLleu_11898 [Holothuria leucospilota]|uniref:arylamine N-acetyltransferase n=1 Tax=Holothuria leucospilota TaxID=206669 RepID=A0A9Q1HCN2_HOLLE|nr:hypothetical protein HOLleu_11898 [Holothuria leucospilota]